MMIHKCDICKKQIKRDTVSIGYDGRWSSNEFCLDCGKPIFDFLKKNKLIDKETYEEALDKKR